MGFRQGIFFLTILVLSWFLFQNCAPFEAGTGSLGQSSFGVGNNSLAEQKALGVLAIKCASCHGAANSAGVAEILNVQRLVSKGHVLAGYPDNSPIYQSVVAGRMPPGAPLSVTEKEVVYEWILGRSASAPPPSLEKRAVSILQNRCASCHGSTASGGVSGITNVGQLVQLGLVMPGSAANSKLYDSIVKGRMPPGNPMTSGEQNTISEWINAGAKAPK